jgi:hypothetical protein
MLAENVSAAKILEYFLPLELDVINPDLRQILARFPDACDKVKRSPKLAIAPTSSVFTRYLFLVLSKQSLYKKKKCRNLYKLMVSSIHIWLQRLRMIL